MSVDSPQVGDRATLDVGTVAHGGHCVARWAGRVVFVRYALPGERAVVRITDTTHAGYLRGDAIEILDADPRRVTPRCVHFRPAGCGGCDFQHADADLQRELKAAVLTEQLSRLAGIDRRVPVEALPGNGFGWRTRVRWALDDAGRIGPRAARSHQVVAVSATEPCEIAADGLSEFVSALDVPAGLRVRPVDRRQRPGARQAQPRKLPEVTLLRPPGGQPVAVWPGGLPPVVIESAVGREFSVAGDGFWQVHPDAAAVLAAAVGDALDGVELTGGSALDLYGGVGLFAAVLAAGVGADGRVVTVESDPAATDLAAANLADLPQVLAQTGRVERFLAGSDESIDAVVLDPPRSGAGRAVCAALAAKAPKVVVYVACDPAALARDAATFGELGYRLDTLRAFDCFPQTHHLECVARFLPA
ncbi:MAG: TRAM domain-containing protein [Actinomycetota bacterium]|nr:TRAM domain-containing protein [Actinomycetota bacterium]